MVIDDETGFVESLNWETRDLTETRDYAVTTTNRHEVSEMVACFDADWERTAFAPGSEVAAHLVPESTAASGSPSSSTRPSTRCTCRTSATRTR